ncbi:MAG TPA: sugar transferase [Acidimicrobiales bacterium]|nr:sugar transferase [Acidimicrobiales bacterium]
MTERLRPRIAVADRRRVEMKHLAGRSRIAQGATPRFPAWLRCLDRVHSSARSPDAAVADAAVLLAAGLLARLSVAVVVVLALAVVTAFNVARVYSDRCSLETQGVFWYPASVATPFAIVALSLVALDGHVGAPRMRALAFMALSGLGLLGLRSLTWMAISAARRARLGLRRTLVVGSGATACTVVAKLEVHPEAGLEPCGVLSPDGPSSQGQGIGTGALPADLVPIIRRAAVAHVVLVPEGNHDTGVAECLELCDGLDVSFSMLPPLADLFLHPGLVTQVGGLPLIALGRVARTRPTLPGKRVLDVLVASIVLVFAAPAMLATALAIKVSDRGPLLFRQKRVGKDGQVFSMLKFRSMVVGAERMVIDLTAHNVTDGLLFKMENDPRVTRVGRIIRRLSLDELPQLWNVIRGEMSLVGPRPLPVDPDDFGTLDGKRHAVLPGITGYWQLAGGTGLSYAEMVKLDLVYIKNWSLWLDIRLLIRTLPALFNRHLYGPC